MFQNNDLLRAVFNPNYNIDPMAQMSPMGYLAQNENPSFKGYMKNSLLPGLTRNILGGSGSIGMGSGFSNGMGGENPWISMGTNYLMGKLFK